jgi:RHS repeat-associated protein
VTPKQSDTAYASFDGAQAVSLARQVFDVDDTSGETLPIPAGSSITGYLGSYDALLRTSTGQGVVAASSTPWRIDDGNGMKPVSLALTSDGNGGYTTANGVVPERFAASADGGFSLPYGIAVHVAGAAPQSGAVVGDRVFYANTATDTDFMLEPTMTGLDAQWLMRSSESPTENDLVFSLPAGASLVMSSTVPGGVEIDREGQALAVIAPPVAEDATGAPVPVSYSVSGDTLAVTVDTSASVQYPVLVDPQIGIVFSNEQWGNCAWNDPSGQFTGYSSGYTYQTVLANKNATSGHAGQYVCNAPNWSGDPVGIYMALVSNVYHLTQSSGSSGMELGIYGSNGPNPEYELANGTKGAEPLVTNTAYNPESSISFCASYSSLNPFTCNPSDSGQWFDQTLSMNTTESAAGNDQLLMGEVVMYYEDTTDPTTSGLSAPTGWVSGYPTVSYTGTDNGMGVTGTYFNINGTFYGPGYSCTPSSADVMCQQSVTSETSLGVANQANVYSVYGLVYNVFGLPGSTTTATFGVDNTSPTASLSINSAATGPSNGSGGNEPIIGDGTYTATVNVADGSASNPGAGSGVESFKYWIDNQTGSETTVTNSGCTSAPSPTTGGSAACYSLQTSINLSGSGLPAGQHYVTLQATSWAGDTTTTVLPFLVSSPSSESVGPGSVNLATGGYEVGATDVDVAGLGQHLTVDRTFNSIAGGATANPSAFGPVGPDWTLNLGGAAGQWQSVTAVSGSSPTDCGSPQPGYLGVVVTDTANNQYCFVQAPGATSFTAPAGLDNWTLTSSAVTAGTQYTMTDTSGDSVQFQPLASGSGTALVAAITQGSSWPWQISVLDGSETNAAGHSYSAPQYEVVGLSSTGNACTTTTAGVVSLQSPLPKDCRELQFQYASSTSGGNVQGQLETVSLVTYPPGASSTTSTPVAQYQYDSNGYLTGVWNPQISPSLVTAYSYSESSSNPLLTGITPPGEQPWTINYESSISGQLKDLQRTDPTQPSGQQLAQWTVVYGVPLYGSGAPFTMGTSSGTNPVSAWGEGQGDTSFNAVDVPGDVPVGAVAIFRPDDVPSSSPPSLSSYADATVYYLDTASRLVNTATPGDSSMPAAITTTQYDENDNVASTMTAANRQELLNNGAGAPCDAGAPWTSLATLSNYGPTTTSAPNTAYTELVEQLGPEHQITLESTGQKACANAQTNYAYEQTVPTGLPSGFVPPELVETKTQGALTSGGEQDERTTTYSYGGLSTGYSGPSQTNIGWLVGEPTTTSVQLAGGTNCSPSSSCLTSGSAYDPATGQKIDAIQPSSAANNSGSPEQGPYDTQTFVYSTGTSDQSGAPTGCQNQPQLAGLPCQTGPYTQPSGDPTGTPGVATTAYTYNQWEEPITTVKTNGSSTQTTTDSYDNAGRLTTKQVASSSGTAQPTVTDAYNTANGLVATKSASGEQTISETYDGFGRLATYTQGPNTATYTYNLDGRIASVADGENGWPIGTDTYGYDPTTGELTSLDDASVGDSSAAGSDDYTATYNPGGQIATEVMPNGITAAYSYDETGKAISVTYTKTTNCTSNCTWLSDTVTPDIFGEVAGEQLADTATDTINNTPTVVNQNVTNATYGYDGAARLTSASNSPSAGIQLASHPLVNEWGGAWDIVTGPDRNLWLTDSWNGDIERVTPSGTASSYATGISDGPYGITGGSDGNVWFAGGADTIGNVNPSTGHVSTYTINNTNAWPAGIAQGPSGYLRFVQSGSGGIGTISTSGSFSTTTASTSGSPQDIVAATNSSGTPTGTDYFTDVNWNTGVSYIGVINSSGTVTEYPLASGHQIAQSQGSMAFDLGLGSQGTVWFIDTGDNEIGAFNVATQAVTYYAAPSDATAIDGLTLSSDGTIWFSETTSNGMVGQLNPTNGHITEYQMSVPGDGMAGLAQGPDGNVWLLDNDGATVEQISSGTSTTRAYTFDADTNRTGLTTTVPSNGCSGLSCATSQTNSYDQADRLDDSGVTYDPFGNITSMPASDADGNALAATYYADGTDNTLTQNGTTVANTIDPNDRTVEQTTTTGGNTASELEMFYDNDGDSPAWTFDSYNGILTRNISDITGNLAAIYSYNWNQPSTLTYQLTNLQGSIVAQASTSSTATNLQSVTPVTEYGVPTTATPATYSWLGGKQRETELPSGIVAMGARVYDPYTGTFLQTDPVQGGGDSAYGYANGDPVNETDLGGDSASPLLKVFCTVAAIICGVTNSGDDLKASPFMEGKQVTAYVEKTTIEIIEHPEHDLNVVGEGLEDFAEGAEELGGEAENLWNEFGDPL